MIHTGDCIEVMRTMPADSVDAVVTDPPYGLEFMGKGWDKFGAEVVDAAAQGGFQDGNGGNPFSRSRVRFGAGKSFMEWCQQWGTEALRVTKPGGYLLAFGGTRTHHRLVCGLEDAGWIIRDELDWIYASGFPKGKANLKPAHEPIVLARKPGPLRPLNIDAARISHNGDIANVNGGGAGAGRATANLEGPAYGRGLGGVVAEPHEAGRWPSNLLLSSPELFDEPNPYVVGSGATSEGGAFPKGDIQIGWNVTRDSDLARNRKERAALGDSGGYSRFFKIPERGEQWTADTENESPASSSSDAFDAGSSSSESPSTGTSETPTEPDPEKTAETDVPNDGLPEPYPRHFIVPKADRADREPVVRGQLDKAVTHGDGSKWGEMGINAPEMREARGVNPAPTMRENAHPTVKPVDLMRHLVRLVTPSGGTVLDCFAGSGSTLIAAEMEGFAWIGIEQDATYVAIAEARLNGTQRGLGLDVGAPTRKTLTPPRKNPAVMRSDGKAKSMFAPTRKAGTNLSHPDAIRPDEEPVAEPESRKTWRDNPNIWAVPPSDEEPAA